MATKSLILAAAFSASGLLGTDAMAQRGPRPEGPPPGRPEAPEAPDAPPPGGPLFEAIDADGDGLISAVEIEAAAAALKAMDRDGDGTVSHDEIRPVPPEGDRRGGPPRGGPGLRRGPDDRPGPGGPGGRPRGEGGPGGPGGPPEGRGPQGPGAGPMMMHGALPPFVRDQLDLTEDQQNQLRSLDDEIRRRVDSILTPEQRESLPELLRAGPGGPGGPGGPPRGGAGGTPDRPRPPQPPAPPRDR